MFKGLFQQKIRIIEIETFLISLCLTGALLQFFAASWQLYLLLVPALLLGLHYYPRIGFYWQIMLMGSYIGVIARGILKVARIIAVGTVHPPQWDFVTFWLSARIANLGQDIYAPLNYLHYELPVMVGQDFINEYLHVGFSYPPPTILLFFPLGWFANINYAYLSWQLLMTAVIGVCIYLLWKLFLSNDNLLNLLVSGTLVLLFSGTYSTLDYAQTNFMVLLAILSYISYSGYFSGGLWLALGFLIKPYIGLLYVFSVLRHQWRTIIGSIAMYGFLSLATIILFGLNIFSSYITERPLSKLPDSVYTESVNQSLLAQILRLTNYDFNGKSPLSNPIFIVLALFLLITTCLLTFFIRKDDSIWVFVLTLLTALLIYPGTLTHYSVLLLIPIFVLWKYRNNLTYGLFVSVSVITATYLLVVSGHDYIFLAFVLNWIVFAVISSRKALAGFEDSGQAGRASSAL